MTTTADTDQTDWVAQYAHPHDDTITQAQDALTALLEAVEPTADWHTRLAVAEDAVADAHDTRGHIADAAVAASFRRLAEDSRETAARLAETLTGDLGAGGDDQ